MTAISGITGKVTSWAGYADLIDAATSDTVFGDAEFSLNFEGGELDVTEFGASGTVVRSFLNSVRAYSASVSGWFHDSAQTGASGLVTFANGYVANANAWSLNIGWDEHQVTEFADGTGVLQHSWIPGLARWGGSWSCYLDDTTQLVDLTSPVAASAAATFKLLDNGVGTDDTFAGNIRTVGASVSVPVGGLPVVTYNFVGDGQLTVAGDNLDQANTGIWSSNALITPTAGALLLQADDAPKTYSADAFPTSFGVTCPIDGPIALALTARMTGALTIV
jgi:hypothetical protein